MNANTKIISDEYLAFIRAKPCLILMDCLGPVDPHHLHAVGWRQAKRNDLTAVPLCRKHHGEVEQIGVMKFEAKYSVGLWHEAAMLLIQFFANPDRRATVKIKVSER